MEGATDDALAEDAARCGIPIEALLDPDDQADGLWPDNLPALEAFLSVCGQWRTVALPEGGVHWLGLDYGAVQAGLALGGETMTPSLWAEVRLIEAGAREARNGERE